jgi:hypothetical protein
VECGFAHTFTIEARKKIRKTFLKETKAKTMKDKIQSEIAKLGEEGFEKEWGRLLKQSSEGREYMAKLIFCHLIIILIYKICL